MDTYIMEEEKGKLSQHFSINIKNTPSQNTTPKKSLSNIRWCDYKLSWTYMLQKNSDRQILRHSI
jgi:hypothetical protein